MKIMAKNYRGWHKSMSEGCYVSENGHYWAQLRPAGYYLEVQARLSRHYMIVHAASGQPQGYPRTLAEATTLVSHPMVLQTATGPAREWSAGCI